MKRIIFATSLMLITIISVQAQEKGSYLTIAGSIGMNQFRYEMDNEKMGDPRVGYGGALGYQYFFNRHWGIGTGVGITYYSTKARYNNSFNADKTHYQFEGFTDDDSEGRLRNYDLQISLNNWTEKQYAYFLEVPLMLCYQTKWGATQTFGLYWGVGAKVQLPVIYGKHEVTKGSELSTQGYYPDAKLTIDGKHKGGEVNNLHGFGTKNNTGFKDDLDIKLSVAAVGELGFLIALNRRVDLTIGGYLDYGFLNIKDGNKSGDGNLIEPTTKDHPRDVGDNLQYNGIINSYVTDDVKLFAVGGKVGLRIKLGKLSEKKVEEEKEEMIVVQEVIKEPEPEPEVVEEKPVIIEEKGITNFELAVLSEPIFFDLGKHDLKPEALAILDRKVILLKTYPEVKIEIIGNTCDIGGEKINVPLGQRRADAARNYLERNGINPNRMTTKTQAADSPMLPNTNEQNRTKNRRNDFKPEGY